LATEDDLTFAETFKAVFPNLLCFVTPVTCLIRHATLSAFSKCITRAIAEQQGLMALHFISKQLFV